MAFADRIRHCNSFDPARAMPLWAGEHRIGWLRRDNAELLKRHGGVFAVKRGKARLLVEGSCDKISRAVDEVVAPSSTRSTIAAAIAAAPQRRGSHGNIPL